MPRRSVTKMNATTARPVSAPITRVSRRKTCSSWSRMRANKGTKGRFHHSGLGLFPCGATLSPSTWPGLHRVVVTCSIFFDLTLDVQRSICDDRRTELVSCVPSRDCPNESQCKLSIMITAGFRGSTPLRFLGPRHFLPLESQIYRITIYRPKSSGAKGCSWRMRQPTGSAGDGDVDKTRSNSEEPKIGSSFQD